MSTQSLASEDPTKGCTPSIGRPPWSERIAELMRRTLFGLCMVVAIAMFFVATINIQYGVEDARIVEAFESDEHHIWQIVSKNIQEKNFDPKGYYHYPFGWFSSGIATSRFFESLGYNIDVRFIIGVFRMISVLSGIAALYLVYQLLRLFSLPNHLAFIGGLFVVTIPDFYFWSHGVHPDVPQAALVLAAFLMSFRNAEIRGALRSTFFHGLALTTKFGGLFSFPFSMLYHTLRRFQPTDGPEPAAPRISNKGIALRIGACALLAAAIYVVTNPYAVSHGKELIEGVLFIKKAIGGKPLDPSAVNLAPWDPYLWFRTIGRGIGAFGKPLIILGGLAVIANFIVFGWRRGWRTLIRDKLQLQLLILTLYVVACFAVHVAIITWPALRYTYHFLPAAIILAFFGIYLLIRRLPRLLMEIAIVAVALTLLPRTSEAFARMRYASNKPNAEFFELGRWFEGRYPRDAQIYFEIGSYVPSTYFASVSAWGIYDNAMRDPNTKAIVMCEGMSGRWIWKAPGTSLAEGKLVGDPTASPRAELTYKAYRYLLDHPDEWKIVYEKGPFIVLERQK